MPTRCRNARPLAQAGVPRMPMLHKGSPEARWMGMGESGPRPMEDMPAAGIDRRQAAALLFLAATFGLMALLSVPISRILPLPLRLPRAIQQALSPFEPILPPFLRDGPEQNSYQRTRPPITAPRGP